MHPLDHQFTQFLDLELGENQIDVGFIDGDLKYYPTKQTKLTIYRSVKLNDDVSPFDISFNYRVIATSSDRLFEVDNFANMDAPILKKDLYAILIYFLQR